MYNTQTHRLLVIWKEEFEVTFQLLLLFTQVVLSFDSSTVSEFFGLDSYGCSNFSENHGSANCIYLCTLTVFVCFCCSVFIHLILRDFPKVVESRISNLFVLTWFFLWLFRLSRNCFICIQEFGSTDRSLKAIPPKRKFLNFINLSLYFLCPSLGRWDLVFYPYLLHLIR